MLDLQAILDEVISHTETYRGHGSVASYIPALARVDPHRLGIAVALEDGSTFCAGDADVPFSIQSLANVFTLGIALTRVGGALWNHVGREPAGSPLNSLVQLELAKGKPRNPLINAGALVVCDAIIGDRNADTAVTEILAFLGERSGVPVSIEESVAMSESKAGSFNRSLGHFIDSFGNLRNSVEDVVSVYFRQCAITMSCRDLARAALFLAFDGKDPLTGQEVITPIRVRRINSLMLTCGHYDNSGELAFRIGLPGKSSISGGILVVVPGVGTAVAWSPGLNAAHSSLAGAIALERLVEKTGWSIFA